MKDSVILWSSLSQKHKSRKTLTTHNGASCETKLQWVDLCPYMLGVENPPVCDMVVAMFLLSNIVNPRYSHYLAPNPLSLPVSQLDLHS